MPGIRSRGRRSMPSRAQTRRGGRLAVSTWVHLDTAHALDEWAHRYRLSRSAAVHHLLRQALSLPPILPTIKDNQ